MATITNITLIDSLNGSTEDVETVTFYHPMTGQKLEIELDAKNRKSMGTHLERMNKYFEAAVPVEVPVEPTKTKAAKNTETTKIREWARENGYTIGDRGRISADILEAYKGAHEQIGSTEIKTEDDTDNEDSSPLDVVSDSDNTETLVTDEAGKETTKISSEAEILNLMSELEAEHGQVTEADLVFALDGKTETE